MQKVSLYLDEHLWEAFRIVCLQRHISASKQVAHLIAEHLRSPVDQRDTSAEADER